MPEYLNAYMPLIAVVIIALGLIAGLIYKCRDNGIGLTKEALWKRREAEEERKQIANALIWDPLWAVWEARQEANKEKVTAAHPEFVIARGMGDDYPNFIVTQRNVYHSRGEDGRKVFWKGGKTPAITANAPPDYDRNWKVIYDRLSDPSFKTEKLAEQWLQRWTARRAAQVAYDSNGARLGSFTANDVDADQAYVASQHAYGQD